MASEAAANSIMNALRVVFIFNTSFCHAAPSHRTPQIIPLSAPLAPRGDYISPDIRQQLAADPPVPDLTPRQSEILESMVRGLTDRDIAQQLRLSPESVSEHVGAIRQKIGAANRTEAVAIAMRKYLLKF